MFGMGLNIVEAAGGGCGIRIGLGPDLGQRLGPRIDELSWNFIAGVWGSGVVGRNAAAVGEDGTGKIVAPRPLRIAGCLARIKAVGAERRVIGVVGSEISRHHLRGGNIRLQHIRVALVLQPPLIAAPKRRGSCECREPDRLSCLRDSNSAGALVGFPDDCSANRWHSVRCCARRSRLPRDNDWCRIY